MKEFLLLITILILSLLVGMGTYHFKNVKFEESCIRYEFKNATINPFTNVIYLDSDKTFDSMLSALSFQSQANLTAREKFDIYSMLLPYVVTFETKNHYNKWKERLNK